MCALARSHAEIWSLSQVLIGVLMVTDSLPVFACSQNDSVWLISQLPFFVKHYRSSSIIDCWHSTNSSYRLLHTIVHPSDPNKLNFHSSDQTKVSHKSNRFRSIFRRLRRLVLFAYGFFRPTRPNNRTSCARCLTVDSLLSTRRSFSSSDVTVRADFRRWNFSFRWINRSVVEVMSKYPTIRYPLNIPKP